MANIKDSLQKAATGVKGIVQQTTGEYLAEQRSKTMPARSSSMGDAFKKGIDAIGGGAKTAGRFLTAPERNVGNILAKKLRNYVQTSDGVMMKK